LEHLNLSHNPLKVIPTEVGNLELLAELGQWEIGIAFLNRLKHLDVSHCELMTWPTQVRCRFVCVAGVVYALRY
jgi:Leucine-rich repeat (LRR) protein